MMASSPFCQTVCFFFYEQQSLGPGTIGNPGPLEQKESEPPAPGTEPKTKRRRSSSSLCPSQSSSHLLSCSQSASSTTVPQEWQGTTQELWETFVQLLGAEVTHELQNSRITHILVDPDLPCSIDVHRRASSCKVVSSNWLKQCLHEKRMVSEKDYLLDPKASDSCHLPGCRCVECLLDLLEPGEAHLGDAGSSKLASELGQSDDGLLASSKQIVIPSFAGHQVAGPPQVASSPAVRTRSRSRSGPVVNRFASCSVSLPYHQGAPASPTLRTTQRRDSGTRTQRRVSGTRNGGLPTS
mmetsp:Transcript_55507/g.98875  ORF Transcript_55507/g.98875 Transcript_55507/m.98875 type:complete len:297 (-) Transcript_55507:19-909(-)